MVKDKFQIRIEVGGVTKGTGKPLAGRKFNGAVKIGEMEKARDNLDKLLSLCPNSCKEYEMLKDYVNGKAKKS